MDDLSCLRVNVPKGKLSAWTVGCRDCGATHTQQAELFGDDHLTEMKAIDRFWRERHARTCPHRWHVEQMTVLVEILAVLKQMAHQSERDHAP